MEAFLAHHHAGDVGPPPAWGGVADDGPDAPCAVAGMFGELIPVANHCLEISAQYRPDGHLLLKPPHHNDDSFGILQVAHL